MTEDDARATLEFVIQYRTNNDKYTLKALDAIKIMLEANKRMGKQIDKMAEYIRVDDIEENDDIDLCDFLGKSYSDCKHLSSACEDCIKEYFKNKVEE